MVVSIDHLKCAGEYLPRIIFQTFMGHGYLSDDLMYK